MNDGSNGLLDPIDRISEILFGLIMAVTIVGPLSIATAGSWDELDNINDLFARVEEGKIDGRIA